MHGMNTSNFDLNLLRVFDAMMAERNVTRAAQRVHLSQPATSHALARLRKEIGDPLFVRAGRSMIPTAKASALGPAVHEMLEQLAPALGTAPFDPTQSGATFRIGMIDFVEYLLSPLFARLITAFGPQMRIMVHAPDPVTVQTQLAGGDLDMAVGLYEPTTAGIHGRPLAEQPMTGIVRRGHPLSQGRITAKQFRDAPRIATTARRNALGTTFERQLKRAGIAGEVAYVTQNFFSIPVLLQSTDLLLVTGESIAQLLCSQHPLVMVPLPVRMPPLQAHLIWHERTHYDPAQKWMRDKLLQALLVAGPRAPMGVGGAGQPAPAG